MRCRNCLYADRLEMYEVIIKGDLVSEATNGIYQVLIADPETATVLCCNCGHTEQIKIEVIDG